MFVCFFLSFFSSSFLLSFVFFFFLLFFFLSFFLRFRYFSLPIILIGKWFASRLGRSEVLRSLRHYLRAQSQEHRTIDRLEDSGEQRGTARQSSVKGTRTGHRLVRPTLDLFQTAAARKLLRDGGDPYGRSQTLRYHLELNCLICSTSSGLRRNTDGARNIRRDGGLGEGE